MDHFPMKEVPQENRPYEKFERFGAPALSDTELFAVILRSGISGISAMEAAQGLISKGRNSVLCICDLSIQEMVQIPGIGRVRAIQMKCIAELAHRMAKAQRLDDVRMDSPSSVAAYYMETMRHLQQEHIVAAMFTASGRLKKDMTLAVGSVTGAHILPREIFRQALLADAVYMILVHNHPSGNVAPSEEDIQFTQRIAACGKLMGIPLEDHIIIGDNIFTSFRVQNLL